MSENFNISGNLLDFINDIGQYWTRKRGLVLTFLLEAASILIFWDKFGIKSTLEGLLILLGTVIITFIIWLITSKRILFRSAKLVLLWLVVALASSACFFWIVYPKHIEGRGLDMPYIQIWGCLIVYSIVVLLGLVIGCWIIKGKKLLIVFAVNNESIAVEKVIRSSIDPVVNSIQDSDPNVRLIVLPFGILKSVHACAKYIKRPITRADAIIFASVVDDSESSSTGYVFTRFSSRINEKRFVEDERKASIHNAVLDAHSRCKDWNFLNLANDNCSRKIAISKNLEDMLRMYIGCVYIMKHNFKAALPYTNNSIYRENRNSAPYAIAASLYSYAMLSTAQELENKDHDYDAALKHLTQLGKSMPVNINEPAYNKAMARIMFYKGDIKSSEEYTKKFKNLPNHRWGYELNMGFYAINKKKVLEFVQHYKNLRKYYPYEHSEVSFAIRFLEYQQKNTTDAEYELLLNIAIAYLHLYLNPKKAKKIIAKVNYSSQNPKFVKAIDDLSEIVTSTTQRRDVLPPKK